MNERQNPQKRTAKNTEVFESCAMMAGSIPAMEQTQPIRMIPFKALFDCGCVPVSEELSMVFIGGAKIESEVHILKHKFAFAFGPFFDEIHSSLQTKPSKFEME
jgi:hypothetical protein